MKKYSLTLFLIIAFFAVKSQVPLNGQHYADSLTKRLKTSSADTTKAKCSFLLSAFYLKTDTVTSARYLQEGLSYSKGNPYMEAVSLFYKALAASKNNPKLSEKTFLNAEAALQKYNNREAFLIRSMCWNRYATLQKIKGDTKTFIDIMMNKAIPLAAQSGDASFLGKNYSDLSIGFKNLGQYPQAETYLKKSISILKNANAPHYLAMAYQIISENYTLLGRAKEAKASLDSMQILLKPYPQSDMWLDYYASEALCLTVARAFDQSLTEIEKGIILAKQLKNGYAEERLLLQKFYALYNKKDFEKAKNVAMELAGHKQFMITGNNKQQIYYGLAVSYEGMKDMARAYQWLTRYSQLKDSLNNSKLDETVSLLEIKFRTAQNEKKIEALNAEKKQAALVIKNNKLTNSLLIGSCIFLLLVAIVIFIYFKKAAIQKEKDQHQKAKELEQTQQIVLSRAMLEAEEKERNRLATDLHDGLGGMLAGVKISLSSLANSDPMQHHSVEFQKIATQLDNSVSELRNIAKNMMPQTLINYGLEAALKELCEAIMSPNLEVDFEALNIGKQIPFPKQTIIYRVVQEILTNVLKHANATEVVLQCSQSQNRFYITVEDNGQGFNVNRLSRGMGLGNIKHRVQYLNGIFDISSKTNEGTIINIELDAS